MEVTERLVWDRFIRFFHWSLFFGIAGAYFSASYRYMAVHQWLGYYLSCLIVCRIVWGFIGTPYARFSRFVFPPVTVKRYLISMLKNRPAYFIGHNPAGAMMVYLLLGVVVVLLVSGLVTLGAIDYEGPLLIVGNVLTDEVVYQIQFFHEWLGTYLWVVIAVHVVGVVVSSIQHGENLVMAMITGNKKIK